MTKVPDFATSITGFRWWSADMSRVRLTSPLYDRHSWEPGESFDAKCEIHGKLGGIPVADGSHRCGVHAANSEETMFTAFSSGTVCGRVEMGGRTMKYMKGWISEYARVTHLYLPPPHPRARTLVERMLRQTTLSTASVVAELAQEYKVPVINLPIEELCKMYEKASPDLTGTVKSFVVKYGWKEPVDG